MSHPVQALDETRSLEDAAVLMNTQRIRHVPVLREGRVVKLVSERDLFGLQRHSLWHVGGLIRQANTVPELRNAAAAIRSLAVQLMAQGTATESLTRLLSDLNDQLTVRIIQVVKQASDLSGQPFCWVALGSEGRQEQTIATDQDNVLIYMSEQADADRPRWQAFARQVNDILDACGYPLCRGGIMARPGATPRTNGVFWGLGGSNAAVRKTCSMQPSGSICVYCMGRRHGPMRCARTFWRGRGPTRVFCGNGSSSTCNPVSP